MLKCSNAIFALRRLIPLVIRFLLCQGTAGPAGAKGEVGSRGEEVSTNNR